MVTFFEIYIYIYIYIYHLLNGYLTITFSPAFLIQFVCRFDIVREPKSQKLNKMG